MIDSYETLGSIWQEAFNLIGNHKDIKIIMVDEGYEIINLQNNEIVQKGEII